MILPKQDTQSHGHLHRRHASRTRLKPQDACVAHYAGALIVRIGFWGIYIYYGTLVLVII